MRIINFFKKNIFLQKGVSLVELLLYMGILSILLTSLTSIFVFALDVQLESQATSSVEQNGNYILARLNYDIHRAKSINIPSVDGTAHGSMQLDIGGATYEYSVNGAKSLILTVNGVPNNLNNYDSDISNFSVRHLGNGKVEDSLEIYFTVTSKTKRTSGYETRNFETNLSLRRQ